MTRKCLLQDGLAERIGAGEAGVNLVFKCFRRLKASAEDADDLCLFRRGAYRERKRFDVLVVDLGNVGPVANLGEVYS